MHYEDGKARVHRALLYSGADKDSPPAKMSSIFPQRLITTKKLKRIISCHLDTSNG